MISAAETSHICSRARYLNKNQLKCDGLHPRRRRDVLFDRRRIIRVELQVSQRAHLLPAPGGHRGLRLAHVRRASDERHIHRRKGIHRLTSSSPNIGKVGQRARRTRAAPGPRGESWLFGSSLSERFSLAADSLGEVLRLGHEGARKVNMVVTRALSGGNFTGT